MRYVLLTPQTTTRRALSFVRVVQIFGGPSGLHVRFNTSAQHEVNSGVHGVTTQTGWQYRTEGYSGELLGNQNRVAVQDGELLGNQTESCWAIRTGWQYRTESCWAIT